MSLLLALLTPATPTYGALGRAGATASAISSKAATQAARASLGATASDTVKKAVTFPALARAGLTGRDTGAKAISYQVLASFGPTGVAVSSTAAIVFGGALGSLGATGRVVSVQGITPFSDVPIATPGRVRRKAEIRPIIAEIDLSPALETQLTEAKAREAAAFAVLETIETRARAGLAKSTAVRIKAAAVKQRATVAKLSTQIEALNVAMTVENARIARDTEEADIIFIATILSEA